MVKIESWFLRICGFIIKIELPTQLSNVVQFIVDEMYMLIRSFFYGYINLFYVVLVTLDWISIRSLIEIISSSNKCKNYFDYIAQKKLIKLYNLCRVKSTNGWIVFEKRKAFRLHLKFKCIFYFCTMRKITNISI